MFKKLISNLPFTPSLIDQVSFYAKRLRREAFVRRIGFFLLSLTMLIQLFAVVSPPQPTLASSSNDLIQGGIQSAEEGAQRCRDNTNGYRDILNYYDIDCGSLASAKPVTISSDDKAKNLHTIGKLAYGKKDETPIDVKGKTVWLRPLKDLDQNHSTRHEAYEGRTRSGHTYYIVKSCAGVTFEGIPPAPTSKCEWNDALLYGDTKCFQPCPVSGKGNIARTDPKCYEACPVKGKTQLKSNDTACFEPCNFVGKESVAKNSTNCFESCQYNSGVASTSANCKPCKDSQTREDKTSCLKLSKTARNNSQNLADANGTTAKAGDIITFDLSAKNEGKADIKDFVIQENVSDDLDYAIIGSLSNGGQIADNIVSWPAKTIKAGETLSAQFTMKVKDPIPATPVSASDPNHFDLKMTNVYGNAVSVKLPAPAIKSIEITASTLPNTGPGSSMVIAFALLSVMGYFFARARLLSRELVLIKADHNSTGGF